MTIPSNDPFEENLDFDVRHLRAGSLATTDAEMEQRFSVLGITPDQGIERLKAFSAYTDTHPEYGREVLSRLLEPIIDKSAALAEAGLPGDMEDFVNFITDAALKGEAVTQPYLQSGAVQIRSQQLTHGLKVTGVAIHKTKFAEVMKAQAN